MNITPALRLEIIKFALEYFHRRIPSPDVTQRAIDEALKLAKQIEREMFCDVVKPAEEPAKDKSEIQNKLDPKDRKRIDDLLEAIRNRPPQIQSPQEQPWWVNPKWVNPKDLYRPQENTICGSCGKDLAKEVVICHNTACPNRLQIIC
jgi:hypothetical protein